MKDAAETASSGTIYIPSFMMIGSGVQTLLGGIHIQTHTHKRQSYFISLLLLFRNNERKLKASTEAFNIKPFNV
jgi:hypothetical protein